MRWLAVIATSAYMMMSNPYVLLGAADAASPQQLEEAQEGAAGGDPAFQYDAENRRDPFVALVKETPKIRTPVDAEPGRPLGPLEKFDISTLKLVGIVWGELGYRGVIRAPDNKGYFVTVGTYLGENRGRVVDVAPDRLLIEEQYYDTEGNIVVKTLDLSLRPKEKAEQEL